jgi:hypothetical protein
MIIQYFNFDETNNKAFVAGRKKAPPLKSSVGLQMTLNKNNGV